ncbi:MAG: hypothetical protein M1405_01425 [Patescibacteria group bacterium]|nr:hypothetical protein [Patescibacteria group bacterium]
MGVETRVGQGIDTKPNRVDIKTDIPSSRDNPQTIFLQEQAIGGASEIKRMPDGIRAAYNLILTNEGAYPRHGELQEGEEVVVQQPSYTRDLLQILKPGDFDKIGSFLKKGLKKKPHSVEEIMEKNKDLPRKIPDLILASMIEGFIETGYVARTKDGKLKLTNRGKNADKLGHDAIKSSLLADEILRFTPSRPKVKNIKDVKTSHQVQREMQAERVSVDLDAPSARVLYLSEILVGNNSSDIPFLIRTINQIKNLPENMRPNVIVVSGLMEGSHKFRLKDKRLGLVQGLDLQFLSAKLILNELQSTGARIVYVLSNDDREIARDGTIEAMRIVKHLAQPLSDREKGFVTYWQQDQLKQNEAWDQNFRFQLDVVFQYSLRSGRRLKSADEVAKITKGKLRIEEYLLLWDAYQALINGEGVPKAYKEILEIDNIPFPGKEDSSLKVTDGMDLRLKTTGKDVTHMVRESLKFGDTAMYQNPIDAAEAVLKQLSAGGEELPEVFSVLDQQQALGVGRAEGNWVISMPGFADTKRALGQKGTIARAGKSAAWRQLTTRRILGEPGATMHETTHDGRHIVTIFNKKLLEKADASERKTIATFTDWQTGSTTARPDLQVKFADIVFSRLLEERPTYLFTDGDIIHGRNYKGMPEENPHIGLIRIEDQQMFVRQMLEYTTEHVSSDNFANLEKIGIVPGNHEWNSGYVLNGAIFNLYLVQAFQEMFTKRGLIPQKGQIKAYESIRTDYGDFFKAWTAVEKDLAGYGVLFQHMMLEKGGKGSGTRAPVFQAQSLYEGQGDLVKNVDIGVFGHWHHPQYALFGNKLAVVSPSIAGLSGFEWMRGYRAVLGGTLIHLGGGLPPQVEFLSAQTLQKHEISKGYFSNANLKRLGFKDDRHFDPAKHGFVDRRSGLQKALWNLRDDILFTPHSDLTA